MENKTCFITGANRGIGKAIAEEFLKEGFNLALTYRKEEDREKLEDDLEELKSFYKKDIDILYLKGDIRDFDTCKAMYDKAVDHFKKVDVLINNAGITKDNLTVRMKNEDFREVIEVNLFSSFYFMKLFGKHMMKNRCGRIISLSSIVGLRGNPGQINYAASKAGIIAMTKTLAKELASRNITVNAIAPGFVKTDMTDALGEKQKENILNNIPTKSLVNPKDIAKTCLFLASDGASEITGQTISVDGGMNIWKE